MSRYKELLAKRETLDHAIAEARKAELDDAITKAKLLIYDFNLTQFDLFGADRQLDNVRKDGKVKIGRRKVAPKYKDPSTGDTWTGRGKTPKWIDGKDRKGFLIQV